MAESPERLAVDCVAQPDDEVEQEPLDGTPTIKHLSIR